MKISVIIPFYNLERFVDVTLDSVRAAAAAVEGTDVRIECICVDDGSTDGTGFALDAYASGSGVPSVLSFKIIHQRNGGEGAARNAGVAAATGEWLTFLDGDDVWLPNAVRAAVSVSSEYPDADIAGFRFAPFVDGGDLPPVPACPGRVVRYESERKIPSEVILNLGVFPSLFRRSVFGDLAFSSLPLGADRLYVAEAFVRARHIVLSDEIVHGYRIRENSMARQPWNTRKIVSMIDYAVGSLRALSGSGKEVGREGVSYLADVLLSVTRKQIFRMREDRGEAVRHWREALISMDVRLLPFGCRVRRILMLALCRLIGFLV